MTFNLLVGLVRTLGIACLVFAIYAHTQRPADSPKELIAFTALIIFGWIFLGANEKEDR